MRWALLLMLVSFLSSAFTLIGLDGKPYESELPGAFGGNKALKIYGRLDCPSALRWIEKGHYKKHRVFFLTEEDAIAAGYRPCAKCVPEKYKKWKSDCNGSSPSFF